MVSPARELVICRSMLGKDNYLYVVSPARELVICRSMLGKDNYLYVVSPARELVICRSMLGKDNYLYVVPPPRELVICRSMLVRFNQARKVNSEVPITKLFLALQVGSTTQPREKNYSQKLQAQPHMRKEVPGISRDKRTFLLALWR